MTEPKTGLAALEALAAEVRAPEPLPREQPNPVAKSAKLLLQDAQDEEGGTFGCISACVGFVGGMAGLVLVTNGFAHIGGPLLGALAIALAYFHHRGRRMQREREARLAGALGQTAYPVSGLIDWLCADEPLLDVTLKSSIERRLLTDALLALDAGAKISWPGPQRARIALTPKELRAARGKWPAVFGGDLALLRQVVARVLDPVNAEVGVVGVELGGRVRNRAG